MFVHVFHKEDIIIYEYYHRVMRPRSCFHRTYVLYYDFIHITIHNCAVTHRNIMILLHCITENNNITHFE